MIKKDKKKNKQEEDKKEKIQELKQEEKKKEEVKKQTVVRNITINKNNEEKNKIENKKELIEQQNKENKKESSEFKNKEDKKESSEFKNKEDKKESSEFKKKEDKKDEQNVMSFYSEVIDMLKKEVENGSLKGKGLEIIPKSIYIAVYKDGKKLFNINKHKTKTLAFFHFNKADEVAKAMKKDGLVEITKEEAKQKKYGNVKAMYTGNDKDVILKMIQKAVGQ